MAIKDGGGGGRLKLRAVIGRCRPVWLYLLCSNWSKSFKSAEDKLVPGSTVQVFSSITGQSKVCATRDTNTVQVYTDTADLSKVFVQQVST